MHRITGVLYSAGEFNILAMMFSRVKVCLDWAAFANLLVYTRSLDTAGLYSGRIEKMVDSFITISEKMPDEL